MQHFLHTHEAGGSPLSGDVTTALGRPQGGTEWANEASGSGDQLTPDEHRCDEASSALQKAKLHCADESSWSARDVREKKVVTAIR